MGTVTIINAAATVEQGTPARLNLPSGEQALPLKGLADDLLLRQAKALAVGTPPAEAVVASAGQVHLLREVDLAFGRGDRAGAEFWAPTTYVVEGARWWVFHRRWSEAFNTPNDSVRYTPHEQVVGAALFDERQLAEWTEGMLDHPLAAYLGLNVWGGFDLQTLGVYTPSVEEAKNLSGVTARPLGLATVSGEVSRHLDLSWGRLSGWVEIPAPELWANTVEIDDVGLFVSSKRGDEEQRFRVAGVRDYRGRQIWFEERWASEEPGGDPIKI